MNTIQRLIMNHMDTWTAAETEKKSGRGRSSGKSDSVYGIKKLRELILDLAVRGKLVPQNLNDEPASELLNCIQNIKLKLSTENKTKTDNCWNPIPINERPFILPHGWEWTRLGAIAEIVRGVTYSKSDARNEPLPGFVPLLRGNNIDRTLNFNHPVFVPERLLNQDQYIKTGDIVIAMSSGSADLVGKAAQATENFNGGFGAFCGVIRPASQNIFSFLGFFFQTPFYRIRIASHGKGIGINNLQKTSLQSLEIPLPPIEEQGRIVAKVDELMTLCDQLEDQHNNASAAHEKLVSHLLSTLTQSQNAEDFSENWQRLEAHFDILFTTEDSVDQLKQTVLELAVTGKLASPRQDDTPISKLLENIMREKKKLGIAIKEAGTLTNEHSASLGNVANNRAKLKARFFCDFITKGTTPSKNELLEKGEVPFLKVYNIIKNQLDFDYRPIFITNDTHQTKLKRSRVYPGDVIMNIVGPPLGKVAIISNQYSEWNMNQALVVFRPLAGIYNRYIYHMLSSKSVLKSVLMEVKGTAGQDNLSLEQCRDLMIPIPSIEEQHRIVENVDELMNLCGQLKSRIKEANQLQQKLADVIVEQAVV